MGKPTRFINLFVSFQDASQNGTPVILGACTSETTDPSKRTEKRKDAERSRRDGQVFAYHPYRKSWSEQRNIGSDSEADRQHGRIQLLNSFAGFANPRDRVSIFTTDELLLHPERMDRRSWDALSNFLDSFRSRATVSNPTNGISPSAFDVNRTYLSWAENDLSKREGGNKGYYRSRPADAHRHHDR